MDKLQSTATTIEFVLYIHIFIYIIYFSILETTSNRKQKHLFYRIPKLFENQSLICKAMEISNRIKQFNSH